jgi:hypothetical protein
MRRLRSVWSAVLALVLAVAGAGCSAGAADQVNAAKADIRTLDKAVQAYCVEKGEYPESLQALVEDGVMTTTSLQDPWLKRYKYDPAGKRNKGKKPDIWTVAPDRTTIGNWPRDKR